MIECKALMIPDLVIFGAALCLLGFALYLTYRNGR